MLKDKIKYYQTSIKNKGALQTLKQVLFDYCYRKKLAPYYFNFFSIDKPSENPYFVADEVMKKSKGKDSHSDMPTSSYYVYKYFRILKIDYKSVNLLDIGCGSGKVLCIGILLGFKKVVGIELNSTSLGLTEENCKKAKKTNPNAVYEVTDCDAATYAIPLDINVVFLANPFREKTMKSVVNNIADSYTRKKREIYVIYHCPLDATLFDQNHLFKRFYIGDSISGRPEVIIYRLS